MLFCRAEGFGKIRLARLSDRVLPDSWYQAQDEGFRKVRLTRLSYRLLRYSLYQAQDVLFCRAEGLR